MTLANVAIFLTYEIVAAHSPMLHLANGLWAGSIGHVVQW